MPYGDNKPTTWDKSNLPSRHVSVGPERAPHRSYYYAMGMTEEEIAQPFIGGDDPERPGAEGGAHLLPSRSRAAAEMALSAPQAP